MEIASPQLGPLGHFKADINYEFTSLAAPGLVFSPSQVHHWIVGKSGSLSLLLQEKVWHLSGPHVAIDMGPLLDVVIIDHMWLKRLCVDRSYLDFWYLRSRPPLALCTFLLPRSSAWRASPCDFSFWSCPEAKVRDKLSEGMCELQMKESNTN